MEKLLKKVGSLIQFIDIGQKIQMESAIPMQLKH